MNTMSRDSKDRGSPNLKEAASLLTKGGTLINDPCSLCSGVQVKYCGKIICINCGNENSAYNKPDSIQQRVEEVNPQGTKRPKKDFEGSTEQNIHSSRRDFEEMGPISHERSDIGSLRNASFLLIEKIGAEIAQIKDEEDPELLKRKADIIRAFLGLLQKVKEIERL